MCIYMHTDTALNPPKKNSARDIFCPVAPLSVDGPVGIRSKGLEASWDLVFRLKDISLRRQRRL